MELQQHEKRKEDKRVKLKITKNGKPVSNVFIGEHLVAIVESNDLSGAKLTPKFWHSLLFQLALSEWLIAMPPVCLPWMWLAGNSHHRAVPSHFLTVVDAHCCRKSWETCVALTIILRHHSRPFALMAAVNWTCIIHIHLPLIYNTLLAFVPSSFAALIVFSSPSNVKTKQAELAEWRKSKWTMRKATKSLWINASGCWY